MVGDDCIFGRFFRHVKSCPSSQHNVTRASKSEDIDGIMAPAMEITPDLEEVCGKTSPSSVDCAVEATSAVAFAPPPVEQINHGSKLTRQVHWHLSQLVSTFYTLQAHHD
jgi:hypothetical protein